MFRRQILVLLSLHLNTSTVQAQSLACFFVSSCSDRAPSPSGLLPPEEHASCSLLEKCVGAVLAWSSWTARASVQRREKGRKGPSASMPHGLLHLASLRLSSSFVLSVPTTWCLPTQCRQASSTPVPTAAPCSRPSSQSMVKPTCSSTDYARTSLGLNFSPVCGCFAMGIRLSRSVRRGGSGRVFRTSA